MENNQKLTDFLQSIGHAVELLRTELSAVSVLRAEMETIKAEQQKLNEALHNQSDSMRQFADIAFDENKFTQELLERCESAAREVAEDTVDISALASEVQANIDISDDVARYADRYGLVSEDSVSDLIQDYINDNNILNSDEVEESIDDYLNRNDYIVREDVESLVEDKVNELVQQAIKRELVKVVHQMMHAVAGTPQLIKESTDANNNRDHSVQVSETNGQGEARSYNALGA
jgi:hypothetical protein